ncbi:hypothetical protein PC123_g23252 [Phytophthora cactorum]|nr:hypothetical protein PC123_g23252 [Phytophthora cactorum]
MEGIISFVSSRQNVRHTRAAYSDTIKCSPSARSLTRRAVRYGADGGRRESGWGPHEYQMTSCALLLTTWHALRLHPRLLR